MAAVLYEKRGNVALVTLNRPEARNAINPEVVVRLARAWEEVRTDSEIRVAIMTGAGDRAFCAGADLGQLVPLISGARQPADEWDHALKADGSLFEKAILRSYDVGKPVIAAVNGFAIAGGMELTMGTDLRIACPEARFGVQEVKWAIFPAGGSTVRMPRQLPFARAMELLLTGDLIDAEEALRLGFLNRVVPRAEVLDAAFELAGKIARNGPIAVQAIRRSVYECFGLPEREALKREWDLAQPVFRSEDGKEGPRAFMEKREPVYKGR
jgi:enoyl-CoA hydratase